MIGLCMNTLTASLTLEDVAAQLSAYLGHFPQERAELALLTDQLAEQDSGLLTRKHMRGHLTASALVLNAALTHTLFIHHKASNFWMQPGGHYEDEESLWSTARREVEEETGIRNIRLHPWHAQHDHPFDIHTHPIAARPAKGEGNHFHHDHLYLAIADSDTLALQAEEIGNARWIPLDELHELPGGRLADRFVPKLKALGLIAS
jgi:8-oxo-dGTP pyrophosphatase MutT (NUDIX family)